MRTLGLTCLVTLTACSGPAFTEDMQLGGETISADTLNYGREQYIIHCYACHGENGDGQGPAAAYLRPPPRDFRTGYFKFALVRNPGLPHTDDLVQIVRRGLTGTAMLPWDLPDEVLVPIVHYLKTFSSDRVPESEKRWSQESELGERIMPTDDPWAGKKEEAIARGKQVYHVNALCAKCHPAYVTQEELYDLTRGGNEWAYGELMYRSNLKKSDVFAGVKILPIDFLFHPIKTIRADDSEEEARAHLYRLIASGVQGAAMPTWKGALPDEDLWSLVYYVQSVAALRDTPAARELRDALASQPAFEPPPEEGAEAEEGEESEATP